METLTISITLDGRTFLGMGDPNYVEINEEAGGLLPDVIAMALCSAAGMKGNDPFELDDFISQLVTFHDIHIPNEEYANKLVRYVTRCVNGCLSYMPDNGFCEFEHLYITRDLHVILVVRYFPNESPTP